MLLIGLSGRARHGKDTFAEALKKIVPSLRCYSFAQELKEYCRTHHDELFEKYPFVSREQKPGGDAIYPYVGMLQFVGTDLMRAKDPDFWVKKVAERIEAEQPKFAAITDCRFINEIEYVEKNDGTVLRFVRLNEDGSEFRSPDRDPQHPSECALDGYKFPYVIEAKTGETHKIEAVAELVGNILNSLDKFGKKA